VAEGVVKIFIGFAIWTNHTHYCGVDQLGVGQRATLRSVEGLRRSSRKVGEGLSSDMVVMHSDRHKIAPTELI